jgi:hypothetical protein
LKVLFNVIIIVVVVALASFGEIRFVWVGFFYQMGGIICEAIRLVMIQILLSGEGQNMDPLVSLYYYAPVCAVMNGIVALATERSSFHMSDVWQVGVFTMLLNAAVAFLLNVASVFLVCLEFSAISMTRNEYLHFQIGKTSGLVMTLCGVLKNILLVVASVLIWGTVVTWLQVFGYGIATAGLVYYGVGYEGIQTYYTLSQTYARKLWEGHPETLIASRPTSLMKALIISMCTIIAVILVVGTAMRIGRGSQYPQD